MLIHTKTACISATNVVQQEKPELYPVPDTTTASTQTEKPDSIFTNILNRWLFLWSAIYQKSSAESLSAVGMYKNGFQFLLVTRLLVDKQKAVEAMQNMGVKCEDALARWKDILHKDDALV